jgi:signal-transduction protein with cAMP-binding, CBS, and nucleotidyltransferase domain
MEESNKKIEEKKWSEINPKKEPLTIQKLKELMNREDLSDEEAQEILFAIDAFANIIIEFQTERDQQQKENNEYNLSQAA